MKQYLAFFCLFVDMHICAQTHVEIYAYVIYFSYTQYYLCIDPPRTYPTS